MLPYIFLLKTCLRFPSMIFWHLKHYDCHIINPASTSHIVSSVLHHSKILLGEWGVGGEYRVCGVCVDHTVKGVDVDFTVFKENVWQIVCIIKWQDLICDIKQWQTKNKYDEAKRATWIGLHLKDQRLCGGAP